jgi:hypothetical protein
VEAKLAELVRRAAATARRRASSHPNAIGRDELPWAVIEAFDADVRGHVERDRRIEEERDRVLIAAVNFAETHGQEPEAIDLARADLVDAIDYLEQAVLRFGIVNRAAARSGYGDHGQSVVSRS